MSRELFKSSTLRVLFVFNKKFFPYNQEFLDTVWFLPQHLRNFGLFKMSSNKTFNTAARSNSENPISKQEYPPISAIILKY